jgi:hypothetical protein
LVELLYDAAWKWVRAGRHHLPLEDELLWHCVYERYIETLPKVEPDAGKTALIEAHLRILGPIAAQIARKRCPKSFGIWSKGELARELAAFGVFGLFIAADRYDPNEGAFSTYANPWIKKFIRLYLEESISVVPRTGDMGDDEPRPSVMDLVNAALGRRRLQRGKAAGGMAMFDGGLEPDDEEDEGEEPKSSTRLDYLQRQYVRSCLRFLIHSAQSFQSSLLP